MKKNWHWSSKYFVGLRSRSIAEWATRICIAAIAVGTYLYFKPSSAGIAVGVLGIIAIAITLVEQPLSEELKIAYILSAAVLFGAEMAAIRKQTRDAELAQTTTIKQAAEIRDLAKKSLASMTGGDSIPTLEVMNFRGNEARLMLSVAGEQGLIITSVYIVEEFAGKKRVLLHYSPGFVRPEEAPVVNLSAKWPTNAEESEKNWGYFEIPRDDYKLMITIRAYNGSYQGSMKFSKIKGRGWTASWENKDMADSNRVIRGVYPIP